MITAETLTTLTTFTAAALTRAAMDAGYKGPEFSSCKFLGLTNGGQFCYMGVFLCEGGTDSTKIFLTHTAGRVTATVDRSEFWHYN